MRKHRFANITRLFKRGNPVEDGRREELEHRLEMAELRRKADRMRRDAERARSEAYHLELKGDHAAAVSKAALASSKDKTYRTAVQAMLTCESTYAQAKSQMELTQLLEGCNDISRDVLDTVDVERTLRAQTRLTQTTAEMEEAQESMAAVQEGFDPSVDAAVRTAAGEDALAEIMAAHAAQAQPQAAEGAQAAAPLPGTAEPAQPDGDAIERAEWLSQKRKALAEIA